MIRNLAGLFVLFVLFVLVLYSQASAQGLQVHQQNSQLQVTVVGTGVGSTDNANFASAVSLFNANGGKGLLRISGTVILTGSHKFKAPVSVEGASAGAKIQSQSTAGDTLVWGDFNPATATSYDITASANDEYFSTPHFSPSEGDWVALWSENQITGVLPHYGRGHGQHPLETHQVHYFDSVKNRAYVDSFIVDDMTANAKVAVIPMLEDVTISNLAFEWTGATLPDYAKMLRFVNVHNLVVDDTVSIRRAGPGAIWLGYCANARISCNIDGQDKKDNVYALVVGACNGVLYDSIVRGTRHSFTTAAPYYTNQSDTVSSVDTLLDTLTSNGHGLIVGNHVSITSSRTLPAGAERRTDYWIVGATDNSVQLALTPGGVAVDLTDEGTGTHTIVRKGRWGTPLGVIDKSVVYVGSKIQSGRRPTVRTAWSTHAEGYGIICSATFFISGETSNLAILARSRHTIIKDVSIHGSGGASKGVVIRADDCQVLNSRFENLWIPLQIGDGLFNPTNTEIHGNFFKNSSHPPIYLPDATGVRITRNSFTNAGHSRGNNPFYRKSLIYTKRDTSNVLIANNQLNKGTNEYSIDIEMDPAEITIVGNTMTGYGSGNPGLRQSAGAATLSINSVNFVD